MDRSAKGGAAVGLEAPRRPLTPHTDAVDRWKRITIMANAAFAADRCVDAEPLYGEALAIAGNLFDDACAGRPAPGIDAAPMLVAATANAAENWLRLERRQRAGDAMVALCRCLGAAIADERCDATFRLQCLQHLKPAALELAALLQRAGWTDADIAAEVIRARDVALAFLGAITPKH